jgi:hypothetical protein
MPHLNEQQLEKRGEILQDMFNRYLSSHPWMTYDDACYNFIQELDNDPDKVGIINALAASCTIVKEPDI